MRIAPALVTALALLAGQAQGGGNDVLVIGDSILRANAAKGAAVADVLARELGRTVVNGAVGGARIQAKSTQNNLKHIPNQLRGQGWGWIVMDGGANDLVQACKCANCDHELDRLITPDLSSGRYVDLIRSAQRRADRVLIMGYYGKNRRGVGLDVCVNELDELDRRLALFAAQSPEVYFADAGDVIGAADPKDYAADNVHPTKAGSAKMGRMLARVIRSAEQ